MESSLFTRVSITFIKLKSQVLPSFDRDGNYIRVPVILFIHPFLIYIRFKMNCLGYFGRI